MTQALSQFLDAFGESLTQGTFIKCTLSRPGTAADPELKNVYLRHVLIKNKPRIACTFRYKTRDEVKNFEYTAIQAWLKEALGTMFLNADLFSAAMDATLSFDKKGLAHIQEKAPSLSAPAEATHDRTKKRLLDATAKWLHELGITNEKGVVLAHAQDKWRQINKYIEIIDALLKQHPLPDNPVIVDMGSGKGYLTFALYEYLTKKRQINARVIGIELRESLVTVCNRTAQAENFQGLEFVAADIQRFAPERVDVLIALHACDTATDLALAKGVMSQAGIIIAAPCCHKQIRRDMEADNELAPVLRHGILEERQAEILTDGIRALLLESKGYKTSVFEFISTEHTAKNLMITAVANPRMPASRKREALEQVTAIKQGFGIKQHFLEALLDQEVHG